MVSALFQIVNPILGSPVFLLLTRDYSRESRKLLARRVAMNSFILLIVSMAVGTHILSFFGISFAGGASGRRIDCRFDRLGNADQKRSSGSRPSTPYSDHPGRFKKCVLPADLATDG